MTPEPDFYNYFIKIILGMMIQKYINYLQYQLVMQKTTEEIQFHPTDPMLKYHQNSSSSCCLSSLSSDFHSIGDDRAVTAIVNCIKE